MRDRVRIGASDGFENGFVDRVTVRIYVLGENFYSGIGRGFEFDLSEGRGFVFE